jgi:hypothetical protein
VGKAGRLLRSISMIYIKMFCLGILASTQ